MSSMKKLSFFCAVLFAALANASDPSYGRSWLGVFAKKPVHGSVSALSEIQFRYLNDDYRMQQLLVRAGVARELAKNHEGALVYGFIQTGALREHRPTLQLASRWSESVSSRLRVEWRKWEEDETTSVRLRTLLRKDFELGGVPLVVWEEPFLNLTREERTGNRLLERNRAFLGTRTKLDHAVVEWGYLNQHTPRQNGSLTEHVLVGYLFF